MVWFESLAPAQSTISFVHKTEIADAERENLEAFEGPKVSVC